jgi:hypothetical protein
MLITRGNEDWMRLSYIEVEFYCGCDVEQENERLYTRVEEHCYDFSQYGIDRRLSIGEPQK